MKLIIAEKPSLASNIANSIGNMKRRDGYYDGSEYIVTWVYGHLFSLCDVEKYTGGEENGKWSRDSIPCFPKEFLFELRKDKDKKVDAGVQKQFDIITSLCNREDVDAIVNAGDADREGEIIIRLCVRYALKTPKEQKRLWLPDQTKETILEALAVMEDDSKYDNLANEGLARTYMDWLYGVNLTRYATLKMGSLMRVGRVIVPIVKAIYDRDLAIRNFQKDIYYGLVSKTEIDGVELELTSKHKFEKNDFDRAKRSCDVLNANPGIVTDVKSKKDSVSPGKLYSLSKLQNVLGKKYKMSMDESLKVIQDLYEKGYLTYPRTNSEYLATAEKAKVKEVIKLVADMGYPVEFKDKKTIFDDSKIESHSALTPTRKIPAKDALTESERVVYTTVLRRFVAVFCSEECKALKTEITIDASGKEQYTIKGMIMEEPGWTKYDEYTKKDKMLPPLKKGDEVKLNFVPVEKETSPPKHHTIETLNNYLKNPFREDKANAENEDDAQEYKAIFEGLELGTEATRTGIIGNAQKSRYIELKKDTYYILPDGEKLIESIARMNISMDKYKTATLGKALKSVYRGEMTVDDSIELAKKEILEVFTSVKPETDDGFVGDKVGVCPLCGEEIVRSWLGYTCTGYKTTNCRFVLRNVICSKVISKGTAAELITNGKTAKIDGFVSPKTGKTFSAALKLEEGRAVFDFDN